MPTLIVLAGLLAIGMGLLRYLLIRGVRQGRVRTDTAALILGIYFGSAPLIGGLIGLYPLNAWTVVLSLILMLTTFIATRWFLGQFLRT